MSARCSEQGSGSGKGDSQSRGLGFKDPDRQEIPPVADTGLCPRDPQLRETRLQSPSLPGGIYLWGRSSGRPPGPPQPGRGGDPTDTLLPGAPQACMAARLSLLPPGPFPGAGLQWPQNRGLNKTLVNASVPGRHEPCTLVTFSSKVDVWRARISHEF